MTFHLDYKILNPAASIYERYQNYADRMQAAFDDIELLKKVIAEHTEKLQEIS